MAILHVRFGSSMLTTATSAASTLICAAADGAFKCRRTPEGVAISNSYYEGDWDVEISSEWGEAVANWVVRVWTDSSIAE